MNYFLDSNIFIRYFAKEANPKVYKDCHKLIEALGRGKFQAYASHIVFAEIVWVLLSVYKVEKSDSIQILKSLQSISGLKLIDKFNTHKATEFYESYNIKYIDSLIASIPEIHMKKCTIVSYDKDFDKIGILRLEPDKLLKRMKITSGLK